MTVFRFSDYREDTVAKHQHLIKDHDAVWWGWWKKRHEPWPRDAMSHLSGVCGPSNPSRIGLIERAAEKFFVGICVEVTHADGVAVGSPEARLTPEYYRSQEFPAWLRFTSLQEMNEEDWKAEFGDVPLGDETFFDGVRTSGVEIVEANVTGDRMGVLHLSDFHFGDDFGFNPKGSYPIQTALLDSIVAAVPCRPLAIVISGDLTTRGNPQGLVSARLFIEKLGKRLDVPRDCIIIAPGNHDILVEDPNALLDFANEQSFRDFVELFYKRPTGLERVHVIRTPLVSYAFGVVNSSRPRSRAMMDYGYVGRDRSEPVMKEMRRIKAEGDTTNFLVLHHHLQPSPLLESPEDGRPVSMALDAGEIISFAQTYSVRAIMHGHQHLPFVGSASRVAEVGEDGPTAKPNARQPVLILGAGSAGVRVDRLGPELPENSFAFYTPEEDEKLRIRVYKYTPARKPELMWDFVA